MKQGWEVKTLGDVCQIQPSKSELHAKLDLNAPVSFLPMEDLKINLKSVIPNKERKLAQVLSSYTYFAEGDLLLAKITPCFENGKLGIPHKLKNGVGFGSSEFIVFRPCEKLFKEYLYYFLSREQFRTEGSKRMAGAVGHKRLQKDFITQYLIPFPPLSEQKRIVAILDEAFSAIDKAKENAQKNLQNAKELFESYLNSVFANPGADWDRKKLRDVSEFKSGTTIPVKYEKKEGDLLYVKVGDMNLLENQVKITSSSRFASSKEISPNQIISSGSVIFPKRGGAIATNKKRRIVKPTIVDLNTMVITPNKVIDVDFFYWWFLTVDLIKISNGTAIPQINNYSFESTYISYPKSIEKQKEIARNFLNISVLSTDLQNLYKQKILALEELKKSILQKAFNGELKTTGDIEL